MTYLTSPRVLRAKLTLAQDKRIAEARLAQHNMTVTPRDISEEQVKRVIRSNGHRLGGVNYIGGVVTYVDHGISINRLGEISWGSFEHQQAAE